MITYLRQVWPFHYLSRIVMVQDVTTTIFVLVEEHRPYLFCPRETSLNNRRENLFKHFTVFLKDCIGATDCGVAIIMNSGVIVKEHSFGSLRI